MNKVMKANEAPKKIYLQPSTIEQLPHQNIVYTKPLADNSIEYTRTDAFIEKAVDWLTKNAENYIWYSDYAESTGDDTCGMNDDFIDVFRNYMKGE